MSNQQSEDFINSYKLVINDILNILYKRGNEDGMRFMSDSYIGMEMESLKINIINLLADCENDADKFIDAVEKVFNDEL